MSESETIRVECKEGFIYCVADVNRIDDGYSDQLEAAVIKAADEVAQLPVVLDLASVEEIADDALGDLVDLLHYCRDNSRRLILVGLQPRVLEIMSLTKLGRLFEYRDNVGDAAAHLEA